MENQTKQITTAILAQIANTKKKLLYITLSKDNSIYIIFPRKSGYKVISKLDINFNFNGYKTFNLVDQKMNYNNPKISFHPGKKVIHVSCIDDARLKSDSEIVDLSGEEGQFCYPLAQIVFPNDYSIFDDYNKSKYFSPLIINGISKNKGCLSLELFAHPSGTYIDVKDIPYSNKRKVVFASDFRHPVSNNCCLVVGSIVDNEDEKKPNNGIIIHLSYRKEGFVFKLIPNKIIC